ncbi:MAG: FKBP-type peptidyl-prolyl cis-trans isomerase [Nocardioides sp.]|uniref:FKBP-type peptidyl-prolyl cis-trans isomerase n=1 Tax=Nocardioides sp. TaxID=35761 RepID=UPI0039E4E35B
MPRLRRVLATLVPVLLIPALVACGTKVGYGDKTVSGLSGVSVTGDFGKTPKLTWNSAIDYPSSTTTKTLIEGKGKAVPSGRQVLANIYIGDGTTTEKGWSYDTATSSTAGVGISSSTGSVFKKLLAGAHIGDRIEALTTSSAVFGSDGYPTYGIGNHDTLVVVIDVLNLSVYDVDSSKLPSVKTKNGRVTGLDFSGVVKPKKNGNLNRAVLKKGKGKTVTSDMTVKVRYLGMTYKASKPFDWNQTKKGYSTALTSVIQGWTYGLSGVKVGSRVVLEIPPGLGYGSSAQKASAKNKAGIPANSTLYFVIDVLSATTSSS